MKTVALIVALFSFTIKLDAQNSSKKILLVGEQYDRTRFQNESKIQSYFDGVIDTTSSIPSDLTKYDAVVLLVWYDTDVDSSASITLVNYLRKNGKLYAEGRFLQFSPFDSTQHVEDSIWHFTGLQSEIGDAVYDYYDSILGVDSEFTAGINVQQDKWGASQPGTYYPRGSIVTVLYAFEDSFPDLADIFAWIPADTSIHAVLHHPISATNDYYSVFLHRVFCNYFGLCELVIPPNRRVSETSGDDPRIKKEYYNILGVKVAESENDDCLSSLQSGAYFMRTIKRNRSSITPIVIQK